MGDDVRSGPGRGYDFVVVGGGTAGCVVAARLSENPDVRVLLIEAGSREPLDAVAVPPVWPALQGTAVDWAGASVVQSATGTVIPWPRGRVLGGSSAINGMCFIRGHRSSYDAWPAAGAPGWGFDDLLPYLRRSERTQGRDPAVRGVDGPLTVAPAPEPHPVAAAGLAAAAEAGHPVAADINSGLEEGFGWCDLNIVDGRRQSAADAYLVPVLARPNLDVVTDALAHRVCVTGGRCTGVEYSVGTTMHTAACSGDVVLAGGTVGSAQLLLLSGIGPQAHLREVGVDVELDLPGVGSNVHDHPRSTVVYSSPVPVPAGVNNHAELIGLARSPLAHGGPDLQFQVLEIPYFAPALPPSLPVPGQAYSVAFGAMTPSSRGTIRLADARPGTAPLLDPNYYGDPRDVEVMAAGLRIARAIGRVDALAPWRAEEVLPGPGVRDDDGEAVRRYLFGSLRTYSHQVGSCRMGTDDMAVVDTDLRVRGIDGLRVADASVMPSIVSANTNATVYGIAERAADLLLSR
ncbi:GMC family oxidoreductase [Pseudonocardia xinjiangensis]|uniref:NAD(P)-binding protein n=1 Tax=Pseudonocardia xinjiangensis TaxID=75289 RepID=A0ABX1RL69_9PSEU|nr:GMC family oxidoreductase N-terminal domain-containing protein [Pseudonocardia xinjiangensis]NMH79835.1 NAD(P)-binding protein [Pseudonocardia xinjiangensis]